MCGGPGLQNTVYRGDQGEQALDTVGGFQLLGEETEHAAMAARLLELMAQPADVYGA